MSSRFLYGAHVSANGIRQHYLRYGGEGNPVIVIPGITSPAITWGFVAERLCKDHDVFVLDIRGRGLSSSGPELAYDLDTMAEDVCAFARELGLDRPRLLGHSMGARIAIRAARDSTAFSRIALVDPPVSGPGRRPYPSKLSWYVDSIRLAQRGMDAEAMRAFCPTWSDDQLSLRAEWLHTCFEPAIVAAYHGFHVDDIFPDLPKLVVPMRLIVAGKGGVIEQEDLTEFEALNPAIEIVKVPNAGHMIPWDDCDGFFISLGNFLT